MEKEQRSLARLLGWSGRWKGLTLFGVSLAFISAALALMPYIFVYLCVDEILSGSVGGASKWGWAALWTAVANTVCYISALMCTHIAAFHTARNIRIMALDHVRKLPLGWFMTHSTGQVRKTIDYNSSLTEDVLAHKLADTAASALTPIVAIVLLFVFSPLMGLACLATMALSILAMASMMGGAHKGFYMRYQKELEKMSSEAVEYVRLIPVLKTFNQTVMSFKAFWKTIKDNGDAALEYALSCRKGQTAFLTLINSTFALLIPIALVLAGDGDVMGTLSSFIFYSIFAPACGSLMYRLMYASESVMKLTLAVDSISSLLEVGQMEEGAITDTGDGTLTFSHVSFSYPGREGKAVDDLSFTLEKGKLTALVGPSGGGKSTIALLAGRFWDVDSGCVTLGGHDVRTLSHATLMDSLSIVFQNPRLFECTLYENVALARRNASREEVIRALSLAQCDDIIARLPEGLETRITDAGGQLSGGERQRIALARAILKDSPIVILDEATAWADADNEVLIQKAIGQLTKGRTVLTIAHRLSSIVDADRILVVEHGRIVQDGDFRSLSGEDGLFRTMWKDYNEAAQWRLNSKEEA